MKRFDILERDNFTCIYCGFTVFGEDNDELEIDHVVPISLGGKNIASNVATACWSCNQGKGNRNLIQTADALAVVTRHNAHHAVDPSEQYFPKKKRSPKEPLNDIQKRRNRILLRSLNRYKELGHYK